MTDPEQYHINGQAASEIVASIEGAVRRADLLPGTPLPSVRGLARELGVSPTTVSAAFRELARRGIVVTRERRGAVVSPGPPVATRRLPIAVPPGVRDLASGNPDPALLPDLGRALSRIDDRSGLYGEAPIVPELAELARVELAALGVPAEEVCLVSGALDGVERALAAQLRPGDRVAVEDPGYPSSLDVVRALGLLPVPVAVDDAGLLPGPLGQALAGGVEAVLITPRGQNPTGAALDEARADELRSVLERAPSVLVVEDDHLGAVAGVTGHTTVAGRERWAFVRSVSKSLGPDLRLAFLAGDPETVARVDGRLRLGPGWVSRLLQRLLGVLAADAEVGALLERAAEAYRERRESLVAALAGRGIPSHGRTGLNVWVPVPDENAAVRALLLAGFAVTPGSIYRLESPSAIRITTATLEPDESERVAEGLVQALRPAARTRAA